MAELATLGAAASALSGVIGAIGAIQSANAQAAASEYNAKVSERNQVIADQNRKISVRQAEIDAEEKRRETRRTLSSIRAAYGSSGVELAGSPLDVLEDSAFEGEVDAARIEYEGRIRNREGAIQMLGLQEQASLDRMNARSARSAGYINAAGAIAGGAGRALSRVA